MTFLLNPRRVGLILAGLSVYFAAQSLLAEYLIERVLHPVEHRTLIMAIDLFSVNLEKAVPTWVAVLLLFIASVLLAFIASAKRAERDRWTWHWIGLTAAFVYLSMDEGAVIHEIVADVLQSSLDLSGVLAFGWQLVFVPLVILFGLIYLRFFFHLPRRTQLYFASAAALYIGGAVVIEGLSANQYDLGGGISFEYLAIATLEELCEMLGVVVFIVGLLDLIETRRCSLTIMPRADGIASGLIEPRVPLRLIVGAAAVVIAANILIIGWAAYQGADAAPVVDATDSYDAVALIDRLAADGVVVARLSGRFGPDNAAARDLTRALLDLYAETAVLVLMPSGVSYALAADDLPYDRDTLAAILNEYGVIQFILFDTAAVAAITR